MYIEYMKSIAETIKQKIDVLPPGSLLRQRDIQIPAGKDLAAAKALSRLVKKGYIERLERGLYYKPEITEYGSLLPKSSLVINDILVNKQAYVTGTSAFNRFGITTQIPSTIVIAANSYRKPRKIGGLTVRYRRSILKTGNYSAEVLQLLDALRAIKKIPDTEPNEALIIIKSIIQKLPESQKIELVDAAMEYTPSTRALVCAIVELTSPDIDIQKLSDSLNPFSSYNIGITDTVLPNKYKWKIR